MEKRKDYVADHEDRAQKPVRKRRKGRGVLAMLGFLVGMVAVVYLTVLVCTWIDQRARNNVTEVLNPGSTGTDEDRQTSGVGSDDVIGTSGGVVYSQEELDTRLLAAVEETKREMLNQVEDAQTQALEEARAEIRSRLGEGESLLQAVRTLFPEEIVAYSDGQYRFAPINHELKMNDWKQENLSVLDTGEFQYLTDDGTVMSYKGIDVSQYQGAIDWKKVAQDGVKFVFIRVGYRGYGSSGRLVADAQFETNIKGATANGIKVGVYIYSQAISKEEAVEEANFVLERIAPYKVECPVVLDVETTAEKEGRMNKISLEERTNCALAFCQTIERAGYRPMLYYNTEMGAMKLDLETLEQYDKWFAAYTDQFYYPYAYDVWQYSSTGRVAGIKGDVDMNISFVPLWK